MHEYELIKQIEILKKENEQLTELNKNISKQLSIFEYIDDVVIVFDCKGNYLQMSEPKNNLIYKPLDEIIGKNVVDVLPPKEAKTFLQAIEKTLERNKSITFLYSIEINNKLIWYDAKMIPANQKNVLLVARNITEYKKKEQTLVNSDLKHKAIFDNTSHAFMLINKHLKLVDNNNKLELLAQEILGEEYDKNLLLEYFIAADKKISRNIQKTFLGKTCSLESELKIGKSKKWFELQFSPVKNEKEKVIGLFISILDINKRKLDEARLIKNKANLKAMFDSSQRLFHFIDLKFRIQSFNKLTKEYFKKFHGIDLRKGDNILKYMPIHKIQEFKINIEKALNGEKIVKEGWFIEDSNTLYWAEFLYLPIFDEENRNIIGVAYSVLNINEKHDFILKIEENELKYRNLVENLPMATYLSASYNIFQMNYISPKMKDISGYELDKFISEAGFFESLIFPQDLERVVAAKKKVTISEPFFSLSYRIVNKNKQVIWIKDEGHIIFDKIGKAIYFQGVIINITKRKTAELTLAKQQDEILSKNEELSALNEELKTSNEELKNNEIILKNSKDALEKIFVQSPDAIIITDENGTIIDCNDEILELVAADSKQAIIGKSAFSFIDDKERYKIINAFKKTYLHGVAKDIEVTLSSKKTEPIFVEFSLSSIRTGEFEQINYIAILKDITQRKKAIFALEQSEKNLKETNISKDKFFSIIAHDLKNPFNNIMGFSELLLEDFDNYSKNKVKKILGWINESSTQGYNLLENLLNWSRSQTGRLQWNPESIDLVKLIVSEAELLKKTAIKKNVELYYPENVQFMSFSDSNMVRTVIRNLISNAIKFTPSSGKVEVKVEKCEKEGFWVVSVADTGVGISQAAMDDIFRIDKNTSTLGTDNESGTGLGLILCKEFVEKNAGELMVKSKSGEGSIFYFTLPSINILH